MGRWWQILGIGALLGAAACSPNGPGGDPLPTVGNVSDDADGDGGGDGAESSESGDEPDPTYAGLPCDVLEVLAEHCYACHTAPPKFGAPVSLTEHDHFLGPGVSDPTRTVADLASERINDPARPMPASGLLSGVPLDTLNAWLDAGAPTHEGEECGDPGVDPVDPSGLPCEPDTVLLAHGADQDEPFHVPVVDDLYYCYTWKSPWLAHTQITAAAPVIDDDRVLHHYILYRSPTPQVDGGGGPCALPADATFITGWAPGGDGTVMPEHVGLEAAGPDEWLILQVHYNNVAGHADALDRSGVQICTTDTPRENLAGILWLGTVWIEIPPGANMHEVRGTCSATETAGWAAPLNVMGVSPHMHERGRHMTSTITRAGGGTQVLVDAPFSFQDQQGLDYDPPIVINQGDSIATSCFFDNDSGQSVFFGEGTNDEMCFNFTLAYPIDAVGDRWCGIIL